MSESRVRLRPPGEGDLPSLSRWRLDAEIQRLLMGRGQDRTIEDVRSWIRRRTGDPEGEFLVVALEASDRPIGFVQIVRWDRAAGTAWLGLFVDEEARGTGAAAEAVAQMQRRVAQEKGVRRLLLEVLASNERALRFWKSAGWREIGPRGEALVMEKVLGPGGDDVRSPFPNDPAAVEAMARDPEMRELSRRLLLLMGRHRYAYNWHWWGRAIIQLPQDVMAMQMLLTEHAPDLVVETGVAHGGSLVFYASIFEMMGRGRVIGVDVEIRPHNRKALDEHPMRGRITLIEGSSTDPAVVEKVAQEAQGAQKIFVCLDSNHTAEHVARELELYSPLVRPGGYLVVFDTAVEDLPASEFSDRPWGPGNSPKTAVHEFLKRNDRFVVDRGLEDRLFLTVSPDGYLRCIR